MYIAENSDNYFQNFELTCLLQKVNPDMFFTHHRVPDIKRTPKHAITESGDEIDILDKIDV